MFSWVAVGAALAALTLLIIPGGCFAICTGMKGFRVLAVAPLYSVAFYAIAGIIFPLIGVSWNVGSVALAAALVVVSTLGVRMMHMRSTAPLKQYVTFANRDLVEGIIATLLGGALLYIVFVVVVGNVGAIAQMFDNVYHLNEVRYILEHGNASMFNGGQMLTGYPSFYPNTWHAIVALVVLMSGATIPIAVNAFVLVIVTVVWTSGAVLLGEALGVRSMAGRIGVALVAAGSFACPFIPMIWGVLYPLQLAICMMPAIIALVLMVSRSIVDGHGRAVVPLLLAMLGGIGAVSSAHPSMLPVSILFAACIIVEYCVRYIIRRRGRGRGWWLPALMSTLVALAMLGILVLMWITVRPAIVGAAGKCRWNTCPGIGDSIWQWLTLAPLSNVPFIFLGLLALGGVVVAAMRGQIWVITVWLMTGFVFTVDAAGEQGSFRALITGVFYQDTYRAGAVAALGALPACVLAMGWIVNLIRRVLAHFVNGTYAIDGRETRAVALRRTAVSAFWTTTFVLLAVVLQIGGVQQTAQAVHRQYALNEQSDLLTPNEYAMLMRVDQYVPSTGKIFANPGTGAALAYAFARRTVEPIYMLAPRDSGTDFLRWHMRQRKHRAQVCQLLKARGIDYVLDFGVHQVDSYKWSYKGLLDLREPFATTIAAVGNTRLIKIVGCK